MSKEIKELVRKIYDKAMEVSTTTDIGVAIDFSGSCLCFSARMYAKNENKAFYSEYTYLDFERAMEDLNRMYSEICKYEKA